MKFSIIIPTHNSIGTIRRALDSIACQTLADYEVIVVDDASDQPCAATLDEYELPGQCIQLMDNVGPGAARQIGVESACGDYLIFVDADDELANSSTLEYCAALIKNNKNPDVIRTMYREIGDGYEVDVSTAQVYSLYGNAYRRQYLIDNDIQIPPYRYCEDAIFNQLVNESAPQQVVANKATYLYHVNPESICGTTDFKKESLQWLIRGNALVYNHFIAINERRAKTIPCEFISYAYYYFMGLLHDHRMAPDEIDGIYGAFGEWEKTTDTLRLLESDARYYQWFLDNVQEGRRRALWYVPAFIEQTTFCEFAEKILGREWRKDG